MPSSENPDELDTDTEDSDAKELRVELRDHVLHDEVDREEGGANDACLLSIWRLSTLLMKLQRCFGVGQKLKPK